MYSFYGGQKGQDFRISQIFSNRSNDLLEDLQARWYSPINVGDYVLVSYGDVAELNQIITNSQGQYEEIKSTYNENLEIDLMNCGKSYTNSIWQKVYIDEKKDISPNFPNSEDNLFIFINFAEYNAIPDGDGWYVLDKNGNKHTSDADGNWINELGQIIRFAQIPGHSLLETSDIYSEENFGFGYRLIACLTGQTPRIQVFHQTIDIEDGDPYVTYDLTNPDKPEIKFYQQRAQRIEKIYNTTLAPTLDPNVEFFTTDCEINGENVEASLTHPVLDFQLPRAIRYFTGLLFGDGSLTHYPYNYTIEENLDFEAIEVIATYEETLLLYEISDLLLLSFSESNDTVNGQFSLPLFNQNIYKNINNYSKIKSYYFKDSTLLQYLESNNVNEEKIPWGQYGFNKKELKNYSSLNDYCNYILNNLINIQTLIKNNSIQDLKNYLGKFGLLNKNLFLQLNEQEQNLYLQYYLNGFSVENNIFMLANLYKFYTPVINIQKFLLITGNENYASFNYIENELIYIKKVLAFLSYLPLHFQYLQQQVLPGDIYIHSSSGRLYQFFANNKEGLSARYIGALTAPSPEIESQLTTAFFNNGSEDFPEYLSNTITVKNNLLTENIQLGYREKYTFTFPKQPNLTATVKAILNREQPSVNKTIVDENTLNYHFNLPQSIHFYHTGDVKLSSFDTTLKTPVVIDGDLSEGDYFIHLSDTIYEEERGFIYRYESGEWLKYGTLKGPVGTPILSKVFSFYQTESSELNKLIRDENSGIYYFNYGNELTDVINQFNIELDSVPNSNNGEVYGFNVYSITTDEENNEYISISESYWASYLNNTWYLTLMTGNSVLSHVKIIDEIQSQQFAYSAYYLNQIIPEWDTTTYY